MTQTAETHNSTDTTTNLYTSPVNAVAAGIFVVAWLVLFGPVYLQFISTAWARDENAHAPFILAICIGLLFAGLSSGRVALSSTHIDKLFGFGVLTSGLVALFFSKIQEIDLVLSASQIAVAMGTGLILFGIRGLKKLWFILALSVYLIVWPGWMIDMITFPLKMLVSEVVANILFASGLPVSHDGAIINAGVYELLVADACAGLNSLIALTSIGVVYVYIMKRPSLLVNTITLIMLAPIAIFANIIRVGLLVLITLYFGYDAGQSFIHELSGLVMFGAALLGVFVVDAGAAVILLRKNRQGILHPSPQPQRTHSRTDAPDTINLMMVALISGMMIITAIATMVENNRITQGSNSTAPAIIPPPDLESWFPEQFGEWSQVHLGAAVLPAESVVGPGEAVAYRAYQNTLGRIVTLVVAYGPPASDSVRLHRPETCYVGQGFDIDWRERGTLNFNKKSIPINRLMTRNVSRHEAVSYWLRAGDNYAVSAAAHQWINLQQGLGRTADGVLVRISSNGREDREFELHLTFMRALLSTMTAEQRALLIVS